MRKQGFTLIELLIVVGILGLLAAIILPVLSHAKENARRASCAANLHQLGLAFAAYTQEYDEKLPTTAFGGSHPYLVTNVGWAGKLYPYLKSVSPFHCPDDPTRDTVFSGSTRSAVAVSYGININFHASAAQSQIVSPTRTVLLFEISGDNAEIQDIDEGPSNVPQTSAAGNGVDSYLPNLSGGSLPDGSEGAIYATGPMDNHAWSPGASSPHYAKEARHDGRSNFLAADGHVIRLRPTEVSAGSSARQSSDLQASTGCLGTLPRLGTMPCAEGTARERHRLTFSAI